MSGVAVTDQKDSLPKQEPCDFSMLHFVVKLVTSTDGCYHDHENSGLNSHFDGGFDSDEEDDMLEKYEDPWLKVSISTIFLKLDL